MEGVNEYVYSTCTLIYLHTYIYTSIINEYITCQVRRDVLFDILNDMPCCSTSTWTRASSSGMGLLHRVGWVGSPEHRIASHRPAVRGPGPGVGELVVEWGWVPAGWRPGGLGLPFSTHPIFIFSAPHYHHHYPRLVPGRRCWATSWPTPWRSLQRAATWPDDPLPGLLGGSPAATDRWSSIWRPSLRKPSLASSWLKH